MLLFCFKKTLIAIFCIDKYTLLISCQINQVWWSQTDEDQRQINKLLSAMEIVETNQCFERLFCRVATQEKDVDIISSMLKVFSSEHLVTFAHRKKYLQLKNAKNVGERIKDVDVCENSFACNSSGPELIVNTIKNIPMQYEVGISPG